MFEAFVFRGYFGHSRAEIWGSPAVALRFGSMMIRFRRPDASDAAGRSAQRRLDTPQG